jgi:type I restriction enzyme R subunit
VSPSSVDSEDALEKNTLALFADLGYATANLYHETFGDNNSHGRELSSEVVYKPRLIEALKRLNPDIPQDGLDLAVETLTRDRSAMSTVNANQEIHDLIKNGVVVSWKDDDGNEQSDRARVIDFENPSNNDYFVAQQMWITGELYKKRCDLVAFVNGIPLVFVELKKSSVNVKHAYDDNLKDYKNNTIPQLWWFNGFIILSNGLESKMGSITAEWGHFVEWKKISSEGEQGVISLETMIRGTCDPSRLLDIIENFVVYHEGRGGLAKIVAKNHQFLGVRNAVQAVKEIGDNQGRLGVFWHTQGSGKSFSMVFFCQYVMRKVPGNWTFLVITDRNELDTQIYKTFSNSGLITEKQAQASNGAHLRKLLTEDHRFVFTLIQKFQMPDGSLYPELSDRSDVVVITDEAHRSQYDTLAMNMRRALPKAAFIGFTGTPLIAGEEKTRQVFGDYVSVYNFKQSVEDGATVPLYYENRIPELQLTNENLNEDIAALLEAAELDEDQEKKLERTFAREYHLITREERLDTIAEDLVEHFMGRGNLGKGMMVCIDRFTAIKMYVKVKDEWAKHLAVLKEKATSGDAQAAEKAKYMEETDMAVIISSSQNEQAEFAKKGLDILAHRKRLVDEDLETKFKNQDDPLRLVFVCSMWITGFDVPSCSTIYLDKPMKNHTLMQTIARANRVFPDKNNGLIVDYVGIFRNLQKALALYGSSSGGGVGEGDTPVEDKKELVEMLKAQAEALITYCQGRGVDLPAIVAQTKAFERLALIQDAIEKLLFPDEERKRFLTKASLVIRLHKAVMPDDVAHDFDGLRNVITTISNKLKPDKPDVDISEVMKDVEELLDRSIAPEGYQVSNGSTLVNLSGIDLEALKVIFDAGKKRTVVDKLRRAIEARLRKMVNLNKARLDYLEKFEEMIEEYNNGSRNIEDFFRDLQAFVHELDEEEQRGVREGLSEEELALFDILTKPVLDISEKENAEVKKVSRKLLERLKHEKLVLDWRKRQQSRADVRLTIEKVLDELPRAYDKDIWNEKCGLVYQHVFDSYQGQGQSLYAEAS